MADTQNKQIDLSTWDLVIVNSSAGKDSLAQLAYLVGLAQEQGCMDKLHVVHCSFAEEWQGTEELAAKQAQHFGVPFHVVSRQQGGLLDLVRNRGMWPDSKARLCTSSLKRDQASKVIRRLAKDTGANKVLNCMGIRAQESSARAKKQPFQKDTRLSTKTREVWTLYPIFDWTEDEVWQVCNRTPLLNHRAYALGMPRLSCVFCVFAPKAALVLAGKHNPELLQQYVDLEQEIGHQFTAKLSIAEVQKAVLADEQQEQIESWNM